MKTYLACAVAAAFATSADAQLVRRNDLIAVNASYGCTQPKDKSPTGGSLLPGGASSTIASLTAEGAASILQVVRNWELSGSAHARFSVGTGLCEYGTALVADGHYANAGAAAGALELSSTALSFGGIEGDRYLGSLRPYSGVSTTRRVAYDPLVTLSRDAWIGLTTRLHVPVRLFGAHVTLYPTISVQADYAWDEQVRALRGNSIVPHYAFALPLPIDRFNLTGLSYAYDRVDRFAGSQALARHALSLTYAKEKVVPIRASLRGSIEHVGGTRVLREASLVLTTKPYIF